MASFTDNNPRQYTPYIAQNPVNEMTQVGMQRQQEQLQGIQKVNTYFENIAGLDMLKDSDKKYTQDKLNSLRDGISKNLSGDFTNQGVVNQIGTAASGLYKDERIQNAYISTANVRKGQSEMDEARKKGESGPANEYIFNKSLNEYVNSQDPKSSFNYKYEKYNNWKKPALEAIKALTKNSSLTDDSFSFDAKGNITGIKDVNTRTAIAGITPQQIKNALQATLSPQDFRQMEIDGQYNYSNLTPEQFSGTLTKSYNDNIDVIKKKMSTLDNSSPASAEARVELINKKNALQAQYDGLKNEYDGLTSTFGSGDVETAKAKLQTLNNITNFSNAFSFTETSQTYSQNYALEAEHWRATFNKQNEQWQATFDFNQQKDERDFQQKEREIKDKGGFNLGALTAPLDKDKIPDVTVQSVLAANGAKQMAVDAEKNNFIKDILHLDPNSQEGKDAFLSKMGVLTGVGKGVLKAEEEEALKAIDVKQTEITNRAAMLSNLKTEFDKNPNYKKINDLIPKDAKDITYSEKDERGNTRNFTFTPLDLSRAALAEAKYRSIIEKRAQGVSVEEAAKTIERNNLFSPKELKLIKIMNDYNYSQDFIPGSNIPHSDANTTVFKYIQHYNRSITSEFNKSENQKQKDITKALQVKLNLNQQTIAPYVVSGEKEKANVAGILTTVAANARSYSNGKDAMGNSAEDLDKVAGGDITGMVYKKRVKSEFNDGQDVIEITSKDKSGTNVVQIKLEPKQASDLFGNKFEPRAEITEFKKYEDLIRMSPSGNTTNLTPLVNPSGIRMQPTIRPHEFPQVNNYTVKADIIKGPSGGYRLNLSITDPTLPDGKNEITDISLPTNGFSDEAGILKAKETLNDVTIFNILNSLNGNKNPTNEQMQQLIDAKKKKIHK